MSGKDIDRLFKDKLEKSSYEPSESAWLKVNNQLRPKTDNRKFYIGIAASLVIIFVAGWMVGRQMTQDDVSTTPQIAQLDDSSEGADLSEDMGNTLPTTESLNENLSSVQSGDQESPSSLDEKVTTTNESTVDTQGRQSSKQVSNTLNIASSTQKNQPEEKNSEKITNPTQPITEQTHLANNNELIAQSKEVEKEVVKESEVSKVEEVVPVENTNTSIATAEVPTDVIETTETPQVAETGKQGRFSFRKVLDVAKELKTDTDAWGTLREAKNEFLSFGKKKEDNSQD